MMTDLKLVSGDTPRGRSWNPIIVVRHGFLSSSSHLQDLADHLQDAFPRASVDNQTYDWKESVLRNGVELADDIVSTYGSERDVVLVGHSMGGLVCRMANSLLSDSSFPQVVGSLLGYSPSDLARALASRSSVSGLRVASLVMLATPNSGAILNSQVAGLAWSLKGGANFAWECVKDLTGTRLFRLLQSFSVNTPCLSVSGSRGSRFDRQGGYWGTLTQVLGATLKCPHDGVVEDRSVDLRQSVLPNELLHSGASPYVHLRCYGDCTAVGHTDIYNNQIVRSHVVAFISTH